LLYVRAGSELEPFLHGGSQEFGRRAGTHNPMGVAGMVAAMEVTVADREGFRERVGAARRSFEAALDRVAVPTLDTGDRLVQHSHLRIPGVVAETLLIMLDRLGLAASAGSACQSGAIEPSHVLVAMGMGPERAAECVRFSFGWTTSPDDGNEAAGLVQAALDGLA
jgi:cysteine desulfurase